MKYLNHDNTDGYTDTNLESMNAELQNRIGDIELDNPSEWTDEDRELIQREAENILKNN